MSELKTNLEQILQEKTTKLIPENIKRKVEIFDVTGTDGDAEVEELQAKIIETRQEIADTRRDLENSAATVTGTGENVTLNQTAEATFKKLGVGGNSKQTQYSGKNLAGPIQGNITSAGITIQATDKSISINGTATDDSTFQLVGEAISRPSKYFQGLVLNEQNSIKISAGTYILSSNESGILKLYGNLGDNLGSCTSITSGTAFTITEDKYVWLGIYIGSGVAINKTIDNLQLEQGSTATSFEPYVGGTASPNPDYPQEITNVTGDVEVVVENKNLFNKETVEDGKYINNAGEIREYHTYALSDYISVKPSTKYSYQGISAFSERLGFYDKNKNLISVDSVSTLPQYQTITTPSNCYYFRTTVLKVDIDKYQFEKGSTSTPYTPHKEQVFTFPLGNEKLMLGDYLADDGIHHVRGQVDLNVLTWASLGSNLYRSTAVNNIKIPETTSIVPNILAEKYKARMQAGNFLNGEIAIMGAGNFAGDLLVCDETGTPSGLIEYVLEQEEVIVPYTSAQQEVYDAMKKVISYEGQTNVIGSSGGSNPIFTVTAFKDANLAIASLDNRVTLLED